MGIYGGLSPEDRRAAISPRAVGCKCAPVAGPVCHFQGLRAHQLPPFSKRARCFCRLAHRCVESRAQACSSRHPPRDNGALPRLSYSPFPHPGKGGADSSTRLDSSRLCPLSPLPCWSSQSCWTRSSQSAIRKGLRRFVRTLSCGGEFLSRLRSLAGSALFPERIGSQFPKISGSSSPIARVWTMSPLPSNFARCCNQSLDRSQRKIAANSRHWFCQN